MSSVETGQMFAVGTGQMSAAETELMSAGETRQIKCWPTEAATAAGQINHRESLACGGRDSGRTKSLQGAMDDPSLTAKQNRLRHIAAPWLRQYEGHLHLFSPGLAI